MKFWFDCWVWGIYPMWMNRVGLLWWELVEWKQTEFMTFSTILEVIRSIRSEHPAQVMHASFAIWHFAAVSDFCLCVMECCFGCQERLVSFNRAGNVTSLPFRRPFGILSTYRALTMGLYELTLWPIHRPQPQDTIYRYTSADKINEYSSLSSPLKRPK